MTFHDEWYWASWPKRLLFIACSGLILAAFVCIGVAGGRALPVEEHRTLTETVVQVTEQRVEVEQVTVPVPSNVEYPPLTNPFDACNGHPVVVQEMRVSGSVQDPDGIYTWLTVRPAGDEYKVACVMVGGYQSSWEIGDLVILHGERANGL